MLKQMENAGLTDLHFGLDPASGMKAIIAIHSTARGAAIGGCRFIHYAREQEAITDALRLARGMSYKAALAGLPHGGGKAVMIEPEGDYDRTALMQAFGRFVDQLGGRYITAMDSGTEVSDMDIIETATRYVSCTSASGDPSPHTALGVFEGIRAAVLHRLERDSLAGLVISIQGLGHVGHALAAMLHEAGAKLIVADIDSARVQTCINQFGARAVAADEIYDVEADVFSPCGLGAILNAETIPRLKCSIVAGSANNQLAVDEDGNRLRARGILYAPDYVINAGGLIHVALHHAGVDGDRRDAKIREIGDTLTHLFTEAKRSNQSVHHVADLHAEALLKAAASDDSAQECRHA
ncbi:Leu/Phe/Val dehydrogenase [Marinobacterium sediminicola]|uniref:Leucine dehydrogenase n=1 Tax=Marinobacterium sediminicola TaxID=518898 RepID=A0ABY1RZP6_9GAMM|nr:amino acid dehydrogenase [Marinobacterium sediminicola]ULG69938.1 amino acid dehydrogenase [Marinobacterium sediminicola]SMR74388.1 leucine dehydrogenase [Marinobacterium sediminicola]